MERSEWVIKKCFSSAQEMERTQKARHMTTQGKQGAGGELVRRDSKGKLRLLGAQGTWREKAGSSSFPGREVRQGKGPSGAAEPSAGKGCLSWWLGCAVITMVQQFCAS